MIKKFFLILIALSAILSAAAAELKIQMKQSSPEDVFETFFTAIINEDSEAMWQILDPQLRQKIIYDAGNEENAKKQYWTEFSNNWNKKYNPIFKKILDNPEKKKKFLAEMVTIQGYKITKNGEIFYFNPMNKDDQKKK